MAVLSDRDIGKELDEGTLEISPILDFEQQIQPASVDLRLGNTFLNFDRMNIPSIDPKNEDQIEQYTSEQRIDDDDKFILHPGDFTLATTLETVSIPDYLIGHVEGRSSLGRLAIVIHSTAGLCDPGYTGQITLELANLGVAPVALTPKMRICQLTLTELSSPCDRAYGEERGSKYQNQDGPTASRLHQDDELTD